MALISKFFIVNDEMFPTCMFLIVMIAFCINGIWSLICLTA